MPRLKVVEADQAQGETKQIFDQLQQKMGKVLNIFKGMGNSPTALKAYTQLSGTMKEGSLSDQDREVAYLAASQRNGCNYCVSAHTQAAKGAGMEEEEILAVRRFEPGEAKHRALTDFIKRVMETRGFVEDADVQAVRDAGYDDGQIAEVVAMIAMATFSNYFNHVHDTPLDVPEAAKV